MLLVVKIILFKMTYFFTMHSVLWYTIELSELTEHERDNFLEFVHDNKDNKKVNSAMGLEFAVVSIFYRIDQNQHLTMNMRVSRYIIILM